MHVALDGNARAWFGVRHKIPLDPLAVDKDFRITAVLETLKSDIVLGPAAVARDLERTDFLRDRRSDSTRSCSTW